MFHTRHLQLSTMTSVMTPFSRRFNVSRKESSEESDESKGFIETLPYIDLFFGNRGQCIAAMSATLGALAAGAVLGWSSPAIFKIRQANNHYGFHVSTTEGDWISSITNLGAAAVSLPIGLTMNILERKKTMLFLILLSTLGWLFIAFARNVAMLMLGRFLTGASVGAFYLVVPAYTSEIFHSSETEKLRSYFQCTITIGILLSYFVGAYFSVCTLNVLCMSLPIVLGIVLFFMPQSPSFLIAKGKYAEAQEALVALRSKNYDMETEFNDLICKSEHNQSIRFFRSITTKIAVKAILICLMLMLIQQLSGINAVLFNIMAIISNTGGPLLPPARGSVVIGVFQVIATFIWSRDDKFGRRTLLLFSALIMGLCSATLGIFFFLQDEVGFGDPFLDPVSWLTFLCLSIYVVSFAIGLGPVPWTIADVICPDDTKAFVVSTAVTVNWLLSFAVTNTFNTLISIYGTDQVFWLYACINLSSILLIFTVVPKTDGMSAEKVQELLGAEPRSSQIGLIQM